jgi:hypothetical protein
MIELPVCPECSRIAEDVGGGEIYCEHCYAEWCRWLFHAMGGYEGMAEFAWQLKQDKLLGIGLDRERDDKETQS